MSPAAAAIVARSTLRAARRMLQLLLMHSICKHTNRCVYSIKTSAGQRFCGERLANCHCNFHCNVLGQMANNGSFGWWVRSFVCPQLISNFDGIMSIGVICAHPLLAYTVCLFIISQTHVYCPNNHVKYFTGCTGQNGLTNVWLDLYIQSRNI